MYILHAIILIIIVLEIWGILAELMESNDKLDKLLEKKQDKGKRN